MKRKNLFLFTLVAFIANTYAEEANINLDLLKSSIQPGTEIHSVKPSPIAGLYEVRINNELLYISKDGKNIINGDIYNLESKTNLTRLASAAISKEALASIEDKDKIIYKAKNEKYKVEVFTDITCPYCTKLHNQMQAYNDAGITIEYLAFPRAGIPSKAAETMQRIWCAEDKTTAMNQAKAEHKYPEKDCSGQQVTQQFNIGQAIGVNATPTLVFSDGEVSPGYLEAEQLLAILEQKFSSNKE